MVKHDQKRLLKHTSAVEKQHRHNVRGLCGNQNRIRRITCNLPSSSNAHHRRLKDPTTKISSHGPNTPSPSRITPLHPERTHHHHQRNTSQPLPHQALEQHSTSTTTIAPAAIPNFPLHHFSNSTHHPILDTQHQLFATRKSIPPQIPWLRIEPIPYPFRCWGSEFRGFSGGIRPGRTQLSSGRDTIAKHGTPLNFISASRNCVIFLYNIR